MFLYVDTKSEEEKISPRYLRKDIKEPIEGNHSIEIYKIIDNAIEYNSESEYLERLDLEKTNENYQDLEHIKIAYQNYELKTL